MDCVDRRSRETGEPHDVVAGAVVPAAAAVATEMTMVVEVEE